MARGTVMFVNKAMIRPITVGNVEKQLMLLNALISFPLIMACRFHFPAVLFGLIFFIVMHRIFMSITSNDPYLAKLFKRSTRYSLQSYYPAKSHPLVVPTRTVKPINRPR